MQIKNDQTKYGVHKEDSSASFKSILLLHLSSRMGERLLSLLVFFFLPSSEGFDFVFMVLGISAIVATIMSSFFLLSFYFSLSLGFKPKVEKVFMVMVGLFLSYLSPSKGSYVLMKTMVRNMS